MWTDIQRQLQRWRGVFITVPCVAGGLLILRLTGALQFLELMALDQMFHYRPPEPTDSRIVLITIDESDIKQLGQWPMSDAVLARLISLIKKQQPRVIGLDIFRDLPVEPGHQALVNVFTSTPNLIGVEKVIKTTQGEVIHPPPALKQHNQVSASDLLLDADGRIRRSLLYLTNKDGNSIATLGAQLAFVYLKGEGIQLNTIDASNGRFHLGQAAFTTLQPNDGGYIGVNVGGYQMLSNFPKFSHGFATLSMTNVLQGHVPKDFMRDRIVFVGLTAESLEDRFFTSYTASINAAPAGVEVHALFASQLLSAALNGRPLLKVWPEPLEWLWIVVWSAIGAVTGWQSRSPSRTILRTVLLGVALLVVAYGLFLAGWWIITIPPLLALVGSVLTSSSILLWGNLREYAHTLEQKVEERTVKLEQEIVERKQAEVKLEQEIVERKQAEATLSQQKQLLQAIVDHIPVMITLYDATGQVEFVNRQVEKILGWSTADLHSMDLIGECSSNAKQQQHILDHMLAANGTWLDLQIRTKDDRCVDTAWANVRLGNDLFVGIGQDISDRKRAEEASVLDERNRMAREIHDTLAQAFTGILLHVGVATEQMTQQPDTAQKHLATVGELARTGLAEARRSVTALRPKILEEGDLFNGLKHLTTQMKSTTSTHLTCEIIGDRYPLPPNVENHLLRIGQEALTNAVKYAQATQIQIELVCEESQYMLRIKDDGLGFDMDQISTHKGFGLLGMSERAEQIGGELTIKSQLGQGTEIVVVVSRK